MNNRTGIRFNS